MLIWVMVIAIFALLAVASYYQGAIASLVLLSGLVLASFLTMPLAVYLNPLVPKVGLTNPLWAIFLPPAVVFLLFLLVFGGLAFFAHRKVALHYKYAEDEYTRAKWERLNRKLGLGVGLMAGGIYTILIGVIIYVVGYPVVQATNENSPMMQRLLSQSRKDLHTSGLDKTLASLDPMPANYYLATDILGLLSHNMVLQERLWNYPAFLLLGEQEEFQAVAADADLQNMLQTGAPVLQIVGNPKIQDILRNDQIIEELKQVDLRDLYEYLKTGKSPKYDEEKILGRWKLDVSDTLVKAKRKNTDMSSKEMARLKTLITVFFPKVTFMATPDKQAFVRMELTDQARQSLAAAQQAAEQQLQQRQQRNQPQGRSRGMDARTAERYGLAPTPTEEPAEDQSAAPSSGIRPEFDLSSSGNWERQGNKYRLRLRDSAGRSETIMATADESRLAMTAKGQELIFIR